MFVRSIFRVCKGLFSCSEKVCFEFIRGTFRVQEKYILDL